MDRALLDAQRMNEVEGIVIGASAGAVSALSALLPPLPAEFPLPVICVVHVPPQSAGSLAELFQSTCGMRVKEAEDKEPVAPGTIYFAPPNYHLLVEPDRHLSLSCDEPVNFSRPSIDVLLESAADAYGSALMAVILTGANHDGAEGLRVVCAAGGLAVVQEPGEAEARAMPEAALAACPEARLMSLERLSTCLCSRTH